jgi:hypothetical protein
MFIDPCTGSPISWLTISTRFFYRRIRLVYQTDQRKTLLPANRWRSMNPRLNNSTGPLIYSGKRAGHFEYGCNIFIEMIINAGSLSSGLSKMIKHFFPGCLLFYCRSNNSAFKNFTFRKKSKHIFSRCLLFRKKSKHIFLRCLHHEKKSKLFCMPIVRRRRKCKH